MSRIENGGDAPAAQDIGPILENLATAYFAVGRHKDARDSIERWDKILAQSADKPWVSEQQNFRDQLAHFIIEPLVAQVDLFHDKSSAGELRRIGRV